MIELALSRSFVRVVLFSALSISVLMLTRTEAPVCDKVCRDWKAASIRV